jgi:flagellar biosynthesis component FlhA
MSFLPDANRTISVLWPSVEPGHQLKKEIVMFAKLSLGQTLVSGIGALLISTVFVLSAVSATDVRIDHAGPRAAMLSYA